MDSDQIEVKYPGERYQAHLDLLLFCCHFLEIIEIRHMTVYCWGWSGGAMVLGKLLVPGRLFVALLVC